jgi:hypothetical protein
MSVNDLIGYPKRFICRLTQVAGNAPVIADVIVNTLAPRLPVITYASAGVFLVNFPDAVMTPHQTVVSFRVTPNVLHLGVGQCFIESAGLSPTSLSIETYDLTGLGADSVIGSQLITSAWLEVWVYP